MTDKQPDALRLADEMESNLLAVANGEMKIGKLPIEPFVRAADELRRMHAENEALKTIPMKYRRMQFNAELKAENDVLRASNANLLEALQLLVQCDDEGFLMTDALIGKARAAIAKTGGQV